MDWKRKKVFIEKDIDQLLENWDNWSNSEDGIDEDSSEEEAELQNNDNIQNMELDLGTLLQNSGNNSKVSYL